MKFTILKEKIKKGLGNVEKITGKNLTLPILNNVLIEALPNFLKLSTTNLEIGIQWWGLCKTETEGKIAIPAKFLYQIINSLPEDKVEIEKKKEDLYITSGSYKTKIKGFSPDEFPIIPSFSKEECIEIDAQKIKEALTDVSNMASPSQVRPEISGVYFSFSKDCVKIVATDSFRLAEKTLTFKDNKNYKNTFNKEKEFILPQKTAKELIGVLEEKKNIKIYISESQILFETFLDEVEHCEINLVSRQIEGQYPSYQEIIPKDYKTRVVLNKDDFVKQLKLASLFSGRTNEVKFKVDPDNGEIEVFSQDPDMGENKSTLEAKIEGKKVNISFNWKFLLEGVLNIKSSEIALELQAGEGPGVVKPIGGSDYLYIVMPIKN